MNPTNLLTALNSRPLLCDGAMGTQLMARGLTPGSCGELWNVQRPGDVQAIHQAYRDAGCDLITTNTFGGTSTSLERHNLESRVGELNRAAAAVARKAAGDSGWVLGDVGPFGGFLEPVGDMTTDRLVDIFKQQIAALYEGGADAIIVETMSDPAEVAIAIQAAKSVKSAPVIATYAFNKADGNRFPTMMGTLAPDAIKAAIDAGADVVGANCGTSLDLADYLRLAEQIIAAAGKTPAIIQPNAGSPQLVNGKLVHPATPRDMAGLVSPLLKMGFRILGGCCGTTPGHLRAMAEAMPKR